MSGTPEDPSLDEIVALCKRRGFIFPSSEIYGGVGSTYDYGHYGVLLKNNVKNEWWRAMLTDRDDIVAIDSAIIQNPRVWEASGHLSGFSDPLVQCLGKCKRRWREDHLREAIAAEGGDPDGEIHCPQCGGELSEPREFNLMFKTHVGPVAESGTEVYLRPETAQGIFINFKNVLSVRAQGAAVRDRPDRQVLPERDHARQLHLPDPRVRADGDGVLLPARRGGAVARALDAGADGVVHGPRHPSRQPDPPRSRRRRAVPLLERHLRHRVPLPDGLLRARGDRRPRRLRSHPAREVQQREARVLRPAERHPLRPPRDRARRRRRPGHARLHRRRL